MVPQAALPLEVLKAEHDLSPDGVLVIDGSGRMVSYNQRFARMWGIPGRVLRSRSDKRAVACVLDKLCDPQAFLARVQYLYKHPREKSREELDLKDGRTFERYSAPLFCSSGELYGRVWYFRDITHSKRAKEMERLRMHREFVANVSHELRSPLSAIEGYGETLLKGGLEDRRHRRVFVETIIRHSKRLRRLVDSLLEISHFESAARCEDVELDAAAALRRAAAGLKPMFARKRLKLTVTGRAGLRVRFEESELTRVLVNLLDNAAKFSRPYGRVWARVRPAGRSVVVTVRDEGLGIPEADLPHIFERFRRSSLARQMKVAGSGLGLSLVKQLVEKRGGRIRAESREGRGAAFHVTLSRA